MIEKKGNSSRKAVVILHNIRSVHNVGSIFRTSDAAGVGKLYLTGYTPLPIDRFGRTVKEIAKTALGAEKFVSWEHCTSVSRLITELKDKDFQIIAIEQSNKSKDYKKIRIKKKMAFIIGNEVNGLPQSILSKTDLIAEIPMKGEKESLNVSVAFGIALYRILGI
ncbi:MAG: hypothetical protein A2741_00895 [Candidatus Zambryskibacteria bacterium RIFCSPHIGHO2_01_FULL_43_27]|uniref:tRNA/rRNA methyltransferase SpoU type domain-containing protein n=1 Tax=Candidatus Zambryskibacteria bacterium RIFCSPLOWO2_01_FULL_43_17 TaxID=1802760 RepID=A0A1G2U523_9BACT|nr:MAG: hypothetical protein A2741_00895 [Candidatus Zambryskibacteria bacterium RIFCSPHIGHO2_01_FULL_43_27]OHB00457.1 MAG: hypothetical protein A3E93_01485 [Candidatus Zambryskibacteria bacterium RIFCSPHIGHO2_12_FULL_43_12b]OHB04593.1 MAG: hypothetical protein A2920_01475 [Candidatus Zambryskibacteria bacterium RIFCSPLOWO2_01_FULL_43_17]